MDAESRKRFEEAAILSAIEDTSKGCNREEYIISAIADHENGFREGFLTGAEHGYKEAITFAMEWLKENADKYCSTINGELYFEEDKLLTDFEADMNKFLEEKK